MGNDIKITVSGNDAQMVAVWQRQNAEILKNQKSLIAMKQAADEMGNSLDNAVGKNTSNMSKGLTTVLGQVNSAITGFIGVSAAIKGIQYAAEALKREYEVLRGQQSRAGQKQSEIAPKQQELFRNLGDDKTLSPEAANRMAAEISKKSSMNPGDVMEVMSTALAFKERTEAAADVMPFAEMSAKMFPDNVGAAKANTQATQAIHKIDHKATARQIQGGLLAAQLASPVVDAQSFGDYGAPAIAQTMAMGNTFRESAAAYGALGQGIGDKEGRVTGTSLITFQRQLKELVGGKVEGGLMQQLAYLQTKKGAKAKKFLLGPLLKEAKNAKKIGLEGEAKSFTTLAGWVSGEGVYAEGLAGTLAETPELADSEKFVNQYESSIENDPIQKNFRLQRRMQSAGQRAQLSQLAAGKQGITLGGLKQILDESGTGEKESEAILEAYKIRTEGRPEGFMARAGQDLGLIGTPGEIQSPEHAASQVLAYEAQRRRGGKSMSAMGERSFTPNDDDLAAAEALLEAARMIRDAAQKRKEEPAAKAGPAAANQKGAR
jgi:hypothetical protein